MDNEHFSNYTGVCWAKANKKWVANIRKDGMLTHLGYFEDEEEAALKYDEAASQMGRPLNFPKADNEVKAVKRAKKKARISSRFKGVDWNSVMEKWGVLIL